MQIKFSYPRRGLQGQFNTFRLGVAWSQRVQPGDHVELVDSRSCKLLLKAVVQSVHVGQLMQMAQLHAHQAHNWKTYPDEQRAELLIASMKKRYPPGRVRDDGMVSVIYLQEYRDESDQERNEGTGL